MAAPKPNETHHARILDGLRQQILTGAWPPGFQLPREIELAETYGVSRMTMNKALSALAREGYLIRRRRGGTSVAHPRAQSAAMAITDPAQEIGALGLTHSWGLLSRKEDLLSDDDRRLLGFDDLPKDRAVLQMLGLHKTPRGPFCLEMRAINPALVPDARQVDFATVLPGQWLLQTMPWTAARHRIRAVNAMGQDARLLGLPVGGACLEVLRTTRIEGAWVTHVRLLYPGEAHQLIADFAPSFG